MLNIELQALTPGIQIRSTESKRKATWIEVLSTEAFLSNWGDASGIEVRSTESRCEAPWIEASMHQGV